MRRDTGLGPCYDTATLFYSDVGSLGEGERQTGQLTNRRRTKTKQQKKKTIIAPWPFGFFFYCRCFDWSPKLRHTKLYTHINRSTLYLSFPLYIVYPGKKYLSIIKRERERTRDQKHSGRMKWLRVYSSRKIAGGPLFFFSSLPSVLSLTTE